MSGVEQTQLPHDADSFSFSLYFAVEKIYKIVVNIYNYNSAKSTSYNMLYKIEMFVRNLKKSHYQVLLQELIKNII